MLPEPNTIEAAVAAPRPAPATVTVETAPATVPIAAATVQPEAQVRMPNATFIYIEVQAPIDHPIICSLVYHGPDTLVHLMCMHPHAKAVLEQVTKAHLSHLRRLGMSRGQELRIKHIEI